MAAHYPIAIARPAQPNAVMTASRRRKRGYPRRNRVKPRTLGRASQVGRGHPNAAPTGRMSPAVPSVGGGYFLFGNRFGMSSSRIPSKFRKFLLLPLRMVRRRDPSRGCEIGLREGVFTQKGRDEAADHRRDPDCRPMCQQNTHPGRCPSQRCVGGAPRQGQPPLRTRGVWFPSADRVPPNRL
jgi:hypothetical protein